MDDNRPRAYLHHRGLCLGGVGHRHSARDGADGRSHAHRECLADCCPWSSHLERTDYAENWMAGADVVTLLSMCAHTAPAAHVRREGQQ